MKKEQVTRMPLMPLRGMMIFPHTVLHFDVGRVQSVAAVERAMLMDRRLFMVTQKEIDVEMPTLGDMYEAGTIAEVRQVLHLPGNNLRVLVEGVGRGFLRSLQTEEGAWVAELESIPAFDMAELTPDISALIRLTKEYFENFAQSSGRISADLLRLVKQIEEPDTLVDTIASNVMNELFDKQDMLAEADHTNRLEKMCMFLAKETQMAGIEKMVQLRVKMQIDKNQKDYYLREQLKVIQEELGDEDMEQVDEMRAKMEKTPLNDEAREKVEKELDRLARTAPGTPETTVSENYIQWILDLPWGKYTKDRIALSRARRILDEDHYGMDKVKERIIEFLAVRSMRTKDDPDQSMKGSILCFVGPPGVGKTSIVKAIARAMDRKFVQMSLGGVRDEAEIFGHRRTYIGAIPGRIISGIKQAGTMNPVFLFDEIDKMGHDFRGDPASAMLEVLDSEQNNHFRDHYLEIPFDLSRVMFVTTANTVGEIPAPLLDRMEIIEVTSYTEEEKLQIAKKHLLKRQIKENGLPARSVRMNNDSFRFVIEGYTREAGVRTLTRTLASIVRKAAVEMLDTGAATVSVNKEKARKYLGPERFHRDPLGNKPAIGVVNGLAYTEVGGEMLAVECVVMPGTGKFSLTGQLGDVMKESGQAALSWVRAHSKKFGLADDFSLKNDIHIHVPEGAVPKDGPSAGVTMATALVSALTQREVRQGLAMTGEITLAGRVLPIGGVKEKLLAAFRAGIDMLCLPEDNKRDVQELPEEIRGRFDIRYVSRIRQVVEIALEEETHDGD